MKNRGYVSLYNVMFPVWMLWLFPLSWLVVLPVNFGIDLLVVALTLRAMGIADVKANARAVIGRVWIMGFVADFIGVGLMFLANVLDFPGAFGEWWYDNLAYPVSFNPFVSVAALLWTTLCVAVSGLCIYWFNRKLCLEKAALNDAEKRRLALSLAICTAPYLFYFPSAWIY